MYKYKAFFLVFLITFLTSCGGPVSIEGDVYLVKGDGKPQPAAAKDVIFLPINDGVSLEGLLTEIYLEALRDQVEKNDASIKKLCLKSTNIIQENLDEKNDLLINIISAAKLNGITDSDGSCLTLNSKYKSLESAATNQQNYYNDLINAEKAKINTSEALIIDLKSSRWTKIANKESQLYKEFMKNIVITAENSRYGKYTLSVTNNSPYNISINDHLKVQFYNYLNNPSGSHAEISSYSSTRFGDCGTFWKSYLRPGFAISSNKINLNRGVDNFGFKKSNFLEKGTTVTSGEYNYVCSESYTPSERLDLTNKYGGDQKLWPNKNKIDQSKGYKIISGKFIPLENETRNEKDGSIIYSSKEIDFLTIAKNQNWSETKKIKEQEDIIQKAKKEITTLEEAKQNDSSISLALTSKNASKACENHQILVSTKKDNIILTSEKLVTSQSCDLDNSFLMESLELTNQADINLKNKILNRNYAKKATANALNMITNAKYKVSTNISGHYQIKEVPRGDYLIISSYADNFVDGLFLANTTIDDDGIFDLSNTSYYSIPSFNYLITKFYQNCSDKICGPDDLMNSLDLNGISNEYQKDMKEAEETSAKLKQLCRDMGIVC